MLITILLSLTHLATSLDVLDALHNCLKILANRLKKFLIKVKSQKIEFITF